MNYLLHTPNTSCIQVNLSINPLPLSPGSSPVIKAPEEKAVSLNEPGQVNTLNSRIGIMHVHICDAIYRYECYSGMPINKHTLLKCGQLYYNGISGLF